MVQPPGGGEGPIPPGPPPDALRGEEEVVSDLLTPVPEAPADWSLGNLVDVAEEYGALVLRGVYHLTHPGSGYKEARDNAPGFARRGAAVAGVVAAAAVAGVAANRFFRSRSSSQES